MPTTYILIGLTILLAILGGYFTWSHGNYMPSFEESLWYSPEDLKQRKRWLSIKVVLFILLAGCAVTGLLLYVDLIDS